MSYLWDTNGKEINQLTQENIPDEITLTIHNFKAFCREEKSGRKMCQERIVKEIKEQLRKWGNAAEKLGIAKKATRSTLFDEYLDVWERRERGDSAIKIAEEKFFEKGTFRKPSKNRRIEEDQKTSIDESEAAYNELIEKFKKDGLSPVDAEEKANNEYRKMENEKDSDEKKAAAAILRVYLYHTRAKKFIKNPQIFMGDKSSA